MKPVLRRTDIEQFRTIVTCYLTKPIVVEEFMTTLDLAFEWTLKKTGLSKLPEKPEA